MKDLVTKTFNDQEIRIVEVDGEPWFVASDVCKALGLSNATKALLRLDDDEKGVNSIQTLGGAQEMNVINGAGVYRLIFTSRPARRAKRRLSRNSAIGRLTCSLRSWRRAATRPKR